MTKAQLLESIKKNEKHLSKKTVERMVTMTFSVLAKSLKKDGRVAYPGFGTFTVRTRKARRGVNPKTGEPITILSTKTVRFKPAPALKRVL
jgi:DNA-binding protein HU-beta